MRQVNGLNAVPVADKIINLQFTYDVINSYDHCNRKRAIRLVPASPSLIQKVNIWIMGMSLTPDGNRSQNMYLATSVSASNMSFCNSYGSRPPNANEARVGMDIGENHANEYIEIHEALL